MAHTVSFDVDTRPMAESIDAVNAHVVGVGAAVTAMQSAVIASEQEAAERICTGVNTGFYMLMKSRMSQRVSEFSSAMKSRVMLMLDTMEAIDATHENMLKDFARLKAQYAKVFDRIDSNMGKMVGELDKPAKELSMLRASLLEGRACRDAAPLILYQGETTRLSLKASGALLKAHSSESIDKLLDGAGLVRDYEWAIDDALEDRVGGSPLPEGEELIPVVYSVSEGLGSDRSSTLKVEVSPAISNEMQSVVARGVRRSQASLEGTDSAGMRAVYAAYVDMVRESDIDPRVRQSMLSLFNDSFDVASQGGEQS